MYENCGVKNYMKEDRHSYRRNFCNLHNRCFVSQVRWTWHFLLSVNTCGHRWVEEPEQCTRNAWFNFTWNHAPPSLPRYTPWDLQYFFLLEVYSPLLGTQKETILHSRAPDRRPDVHFLLHLFDLYKRKMTRFHNFYECFPEFIESFFPEFIDNGCHNLVKTWTINLKMKTKKKNSLKRASLTEHFIRRLDQISLSLYVSKACIHFHIKNYLKLSWRNSSVLAFQKTKSIQVRIIHTFISNFKTYL